MSEQWGKWDRFVEKVIDVVGMTAGICLIAIAIGLVILMGRLIISNLGL